MRSLLNAHPRIVIGPETGLFCNALDSVHLADTLAISKEEVQSAYRRACCLGEFVDRLMGCVVERSNKPRWGEKSPCNVNAIEHIFHYFPKARFIHMIRDGRDVVCSLRHHPKYRWEKGVRIPTNICNPWSQCVGRWVHDTTNGMKWRHDSRYREIRYEDLVANPEIVARETLNWLHEEWDPSVLAYYETHEERSSDVANPGVKMPIYKTAKNRWTNEWNAELSAAFSRDAHALLTELGYAPDDAWIASVSLASA
jgi:hypothetical protein